MRLVLDAGSFGGFRGTDEDGGRWSCAYVVSPAIWSYGKCHKPYEAYEVWRLLTQTSAKRSAPKDSDVPVGVSQEAQEGEA